ncbi:MAG: TetR family transcriptional regulator [Hyphomicrobium sp.]|nr:TetR family transcriptional regulator [Hyphomicrobium sp.]
MIDETTDKGRIISATMRLAADRPWDSVVMRDIADAAGLDLVAMRKAFPSKVAILSAFSRAIDDAVLARVPRFTDGEAARDRLFDVIMIRFDVLSPYKAALRSIHATRAMDAELVRRMMATQAWMLHAAGIPTDGIMGLARVGGLASIYASVLETWLEDDDPGHGRTMAAVDRRLKRGEQAVRTLGDAMQGVSRLADGVRDVMRGTTVRRSGSAPGTPTPQSASPTEPRDVTPPAAAL